MPDLDRYLYDQLRAQAAGVDVPAGDVHAVMGRGRRHRHRRAGASVLAVMAVAGTVTGLVVSNASGGRPAQISIGAPTSAPAVGSARLTWRVVPTTAGLSDLASLASSGSISYAVSTAPGVAAAGNEAVQQLYRSADGLSWTTATGPTGLSATGVAVDGNHVYAVGTGPVTAATGVSGAETAAVSWTDNGGGSWQNSVLPVDLHAPAGDVTVDGESVNVAAEPKGVVAAVTINATADLSRLVPGVSAKTLWTTDAKGVEVLGAQVSSQCGLGAGGKQSAPLKPRVAFTVKANNPRPAAGLRQKLRGVFAATPPFSEGPLTTVPCVGPGGQQTHFVPADRAYRVVKTYSWSQLNIRGQVEQVLQGQPLVFFSSDGTHFRQVSLPAGAAGQAYVTATPGGFAMETPGVDGPPLVMQSVDGQHWTPAPFSLPGATTGTSAIGYVDGHLVVVGATQTSTVAYTLLSDGWQTAPLPWNVMGVSFGPLGVAVVGMSENGAPGSWQVLFSRNGLQWSSASLVNLSGGAVGNANVVVRANQVVVTVTRPAAGQPSGGPPGQVQVVGTPAG
jgi:hypothetical protein